MGIGGVGWEVTSGWGHVRGFAEWRKPIGGSQWRWSKTRRGERLLAGVASGSSSPPRIQLNMTGFLAAKRMAGQVSLVDWFEKREEKRERLEG
jgi:hypothetical protein